MIIIRRLLLGGGLSSSIVVVVQPAAAVGVVFFFAHFYFCGFNNLLVYKAAGIDLSCITGEGPPVVPMTRRRLLLLFSSINPGRYVLRSAGRCLLLLLIKNSLHVYAESGAQMRVIHLDV